MDRAGILRGRAACTGARSPGRAENDFFSFARLTRPRTGTPPGRSRRSCWSAGLRPSARSLTGGELVRTLGRIARRPSRRRAVWRWFKKRVGVSVWTRQWFTFAVARDVYDGVPAIYVNYLDYDEAAHCVRPPEWQRLRRASRSRSLAPADPAARSVECPATATTLYVLADHGQAPSTPYSDAGRRATIRARVLRRDPSSAVPDRGLATESARRRCRRRRRRIRRTATGRPPRSGQEGLDLGFEPISRRARGVRAWRRPRGLGRAERVRVLPWTRRDQLSLEAVEARWPGLPALLSKSAGVGFVLVRAKDGPVCFWRGQAQSPRGSRVRTVRERRIGAVSPAGPDDPDGDAECRRSRRLRHRRAGRSRVLHRRGGRARRAVAGGASHVHRGVRPGRPVPRSLDHPLQLYDLFIPVPVRATTARTDGP